MPRIEFHFENDFRLFDIDAYKVWIERIIESEKYLTGDINYIFCSDDELAKIHLQYMGKEDLTDIITFDYVKDKEVSGDIFISTERVKENAKIFEVSAEEEMLRVMSHGLLHLMGFKDKSEGDRIKMREKEDEKIRMFHVEQ